MCVLEKVERLLPFSTCVPTRMWDVSFVALMSVLGKEMFYVHLSGESLLKDCWRTRAHLHLRIDRDFITMASWSKG